MGGPPQVQRSRRKSNPQQQQQQQQPPPAGWITFHSYDEERKWVEERRHKRQKRPSKFDQPPTAEQQQAAALLLLNNQNNPAAATSAVTASGDALPQQTRHARRLYVGNLPLGITEQQVHTAVVDAIRTALPPNSGIDVVTEDPILSVYINHERRFCFLEFKSVELCSACMALDGLVLDPRQPPVKVKRPNDYNPALAPVNTNIPVLDVAKLGIIASTVNDGPNKIFIGGLHYHLVEAQVLELLQAFGRIQSFHLVKNEPDAPTSKGYCFVEYVDPAVTPVAVAGLNGMDIGGGKTLTARLAGQRAGAPAVAAAAQPAAADAALPGAPPPDRTIVTGYDVEAIVDAAMGQGPMPLVPTYLDAYGQPLTRIVPVLPVPTTAAAAAPIMTNQGLLATLQQVQQQQPLQQAKTRVLVLLNMVSDDDLATEDDHRALVEEVRDECSKYGALKTVLIPRQANHQGVSESAVRKVFLEYATVADALQAERELTGRQFGPNTVSTEYYSESDFAAGQLR